MRILIARRRYEAQEVVVTLINSGKPAGEIRMGVHFYPAGLLSVHVRIAICLMGVGVGVGVMLACARSGGGGEGPARRGYYGAAGPVRARARPRRARACRALRLMDIRIALRLMDIRIAGTRS